jgi:hypothetical protein
MTNFRKMLDEIEAHRASLPPEVRAKLEAAMDVHDLARALCAYPDEDATCRSAPWSAIWSAYYDANTIWPLIEAHTRAAVEAERARCLAIVEPPLMHRKGRIGLWRQRRAEMADAIRKAKP